MPSVKKNNSIEILRIFFTFTIIIFHIFGILDPKMETIFYARHARIIVEFFYIISGYFLYKLFLKNNDFNNMAIKKIFRLFPVVFVMVIFISIFEHQALYKLIPDLFLLSSIGIANKAVTGGYCWFVYPLFWISCLYFALLIIIKDKFKFNFLNIIMIYFSLVILSTYNIQFSYTTDNILNIFNAGMLRAIAGIGTGVFISMNLENINSKIKNKERVFLTGIEIFLFIYLFAQLIFIKAKHTIPSSVVMLIVFCLLFISFIYKLGYFSQLLDKFNISFLSKYCYCWYVAQCIPKEILPVDTNIYQYVALSLLITILTGIFAYHLIEKPAEKYLKKCLSSSRERERESNNVL